MDVKLLIDTLAQNAKPLGMALAVVCILALVVRTRFAKRVRKVVEEIIFENWQLGILAATGIALSIAAGMRTWEGMVNFTNEPLLSAMITFGIQGIMLIVAWLIGESFATGMNVTSSAAPSSRVNRTVQTWLGTGIGLLLFIAGFVLFLQWTGQADIRQADAQDLSWSMSGDKFLMFAAGLLLAALVTLYAANDMVKPYLQGIRIIVRNSILWVMFLACMATSVFFSFDSFFTSIFPQSERVRAAELRAQNQVAGIIADIDQAIAARRNSEADVLMKSDAWSAYESQLNGVAKAAADSEGAIERYINDLIEGRRRAVKDQQERMASAQSGQAGLATRKTSLTEEKARLIADRPALAAEYAQKKAEVDAKQRDADAKRIEALAEDKGVEGSGKQGRGPIYRQRMSELALMQAAVKIADERARDAQKRLNTVESRLAAIDRELAMIDGDLAKLKGEAETAEQRIMLAEQAATIDTGPKLDPSRILPSFVQTIGEFRTAPTVEHLAHVQNLCGDISNALAATPNTKEMIAGYSCDPKMVADAAGPLFTLLAGSKTFEQQCIGGDKLNAHKTADDLFAFARKCLSDSALPSADTDALRTKINFIELSRDDKAHRFVVTWNAFQDGNRLAYLALAIAIGLDGLIFMSGLFGANAVRSPLSDIPTHKSRSAAQLEATINAALGPHPYETAWLTLNTLRPITNTEGFSAVADLSTMERSSADRVRMVLTAGADIGAVESIGGTAEQYRVRSELREYLSSVCDKHFKSNSDAKDRARLDQLVNAALAPFPQEHAEIVLHVLEPIRETEGFTSMVTLSDIESTYEGRVVRRVMNAGSAVKAVAPDQKIADRYYIRPTLYETLLTIRATAPASANYMYERNRFEGIQHRPAIDGGPLNANQPELPLQQRPPELPPPPRALPRRASLTPEEQTRLYKHFRAELLAAIDLTPEIVDQRLASSAAHQAIEQAWKALHDAGKSRADLGHFLRQFQNMQESKLSAAYSDLVSENDGDERKAAILMSAEDQIQTNLALYHLFPEAGLLDYLIDELERAAQPDDGLQDGEQMLKDKLRFVREGLDELNLSNPRSWDEIKQRLSAGARNGSNDFYKRFAPRQDDGDDGDI